MSLREFQDENGRAWEVWDVQPSSVQTQTISGPPGSGIDQQAGRILRFDLPTELRGGWLAFQSNGESRRLAPIPTSWVALADQDLALLVRVAKPTPRLTER